MLLLPYPCTCVHFGVLSFHHTRAVATHFDRSGSPTRRCLAAAAAASPCTLISVSEVDAFNLFYGPPANLVVVRIAAIGMIG
jgi:hypothetical protein